MVFSPTILKVNVQLRALKDLGLLVCYSQSTFYVALSLSLYETMQI